MANPRSSGSLREFQSLFGGGVVSGLTDRQLLDRFADRRDEAAFAALVDRHGSMVWGVCRRVLHDPADVGDAFQATFLVLVRRADSIRVDESLSPWLYGVSIRVAKRARTVAIRKRRRERTNRELPEPVAHVAVPDFELRLLIDEELQRLPARYRLAIILCYLEGLTHEETARRLSCPVGTVRSRLARGRDLLRSRLERRGLAPGASTLASVIVPASGRPDPLFTTTVQAVTRLAAGRSLAGVVPVSVEVLVAGVMRTMVLTKFAILASILGASLLGLATLGGHGAVTRPPARNGQAASIPPRVARQTAAVDDAPLLALNLEASKDSDRTPEAEFAALLKEYDAAMADWSKMSPGVKSTDPAWIPKGEKTPTWTFAPRFVKFAEANPNDATAVEAALKVLGMPRSRDKGIFPSYIRARDLLIRHHLQDKRVVQFMLDRPFLDAGQTEPYFQALLAASRDRDTLGRAAMALVACHEMRARIAARPYFDHSEDNPEYLVVTRYLVDRLDPDYVRSFRTVDSEALARVREALLERVVREFGDVPLVSPWAKPEAQARGKAAGATLGKRAEDKLNALRTVGVGMVAPEIEGTDVDGAPLRLSDYRGKVVVLVFWGTWCGPCMAFLPTEKTLAERLKDRPFALLGVNSDKDRAALKSASTEKGITWRSWFDGGSANGPIASHWNVHGWPTIVVLDKAGVIRFKGLPHHTPKPLNDAVDSLLAEK